MAPPIPTHQQTDVARVRLSVPQLFLILAGIGSVVVSIIGAGWAVWSSLDHRFVANESHANRHDVEIATMAQAVTQNKEAVEAAVKQAADLQRETNAKLEEIKKSLNELAIQVAKIGANKP